MPRHIPSTIFSLVIYGWCSFPRTPLLSHTFVLRVNRRLNISDFTQSTRRRTVSCRRTIKEYHIVPDYPALYICIPPTTHNFHGHDDPQFTLSSFHRTLFTFPHVMNRCLMTRISPQSNASYGLRFRSQVFYIYVIVQFLSLLASLRIPLPLKSQWNCLTISFE